MVCRAALKSGAPHRGYIDRKKENVIFTPLYLVDTLSDYNQIFCRVFHQLEESTFQIGRKSLKPFPRYVRAAKVSVFFFVFFLVLILLLRLSQTCKNCYKTQMHTPIALNFGTQKGSPKANPSIQCGANPMNG